MLCYGRVPTNWWPHRVLCALWTRRPIVKVAMGCRTELAAVHIAHVLQRLHFFQFFNFFKNNLHALPQKKIARPYRKKKTIFVYNSHDLPQKKITRIYRKQKITRLDDFFVHDLHFSLLLVCLGCQCVSAAAVLLLCSLVYPLGFGGGGAAAAVSLLQENVISNLMKRCQLLDIAGVAPPSPLVVQSKKC